MWLQTILLQTFPTAKKLKTHKITMVGTVLQNRKEILEEVNLDKKDELYTSRFLLSV